MTLFFNQIVAGVATGMLIGLLGLALMMVYEASRVPNLGQGSIATLSAYLYWQLTKWGLGVVPAILVDLVVSYGIGIALERILIRPLSDTSELAMLAVTAALYLGITAVIGLIWGYNGATVNSPFGNGVQHIDGVVISDHEIGMTVLGAIAAVCTWVFLHRTPFGLRMRATATNRQSAAYTGVNVGRVIGQGWGLAAALGVIVGVMMAPITELSPDMMDSFILMTFAAFLFGGAGSTLGIMLGGLIIGIVTNLGYSYIPFVSGDISDVVPFAVILLVLLIRPQGMFGRLSATRS